MLLVGKLRACLLYLSHNANFSTVKAYTSKLQEVPAVIRGLYDKRLCDQEVTSIEPLLFSGCYHVCTSGSSTSSPQGILLRRHRGGKVKNKLRNIEKRKKREQSMQKLSPDVKLH